MGNNKKLKSPADKKAEENIPLGSFKFGDKTYKVVKHAANIPGIGKLTAADICAHEEAQKYLVECGASIIEEVIE